VYITRYKIKQEVKMKKRINNVSQLFITTELYKVIIEQNLSPSNTKALIEAIENGVEKANKYDAELQGVKFDA
tara:strand:+ start:3790 stop:4008 length:219 start_codon:yes stop_codon:yes gene_type:complete